MVLPAAEVATSGTRCNAMSGKDPPDKLTYEYDFISRESYFNEITIIGCII